MLNDIFVCGSSVASGYGKGKLDQQMGYNLKSWVTGLAEHTNANNVWNVSLPSKPIGLSTADAVQFVRQYWEKYRSFDNLFVIVEYTLPQYKHWDPIAVARNDAKEEIEVIPITFFKMGKNTDHLTVDDPRYRGINHVGNKFLKRNTEEYNMLSPTSTNPLYEEISAADLDKTFVNQMHKRSKDWLKYDILDSETGAPQLSEKKMTTYLRYASDEIFSLRNYLESFNIPFLMFWAGGQTDTFCKKVDKYFAPLIESHRLIPMAQFSCNRAANEWSEESWGVHPDEIGHKRIAEFVYDWIHTHKLYTRPNSKIFTGDFVQH